MFRRESEFHVVPPAEAESEGITALQTQWKNALAGYKYLGNSKIISTKQDREERLFYVLSSLQESATQVQLTLIRDDLAVFKAKRTYTKFEPAPGAAPAVIINYEFQHLPDPTSAGITASFVRSAVDKVISGKLE